MTDELDHQREASRSAVSSTLKRGREQDHDEEMDVASRDESLRDQSLPTSAVDNVSEVPEASVNIESAGERESVGREIEGMDFGIPHELVHEHEIPHELANEHEPFIEPTV